MNPVQQYLLHRFPRLKLNNHKIVSPATPRYNCVAWAAEDSTRWWWPSNNYWPSGSVKEVQLEAFEGMFEVLGYKKCDDPKPEAGYIKIAIFIHIADGKPTHVARQLSNGKWTSKMGPQHDIEHDQPDLLCGSEYGNIASYMRKRQQKNA